MKCTFTFKLTVAAASLIISGSSCAAEIGSYFPSWSAEGSFRLKNLDNAGLAGQFTYLNYAFENIYKMPDGTYRCNNGSDLGDHDQGYGMRASLDYANLISADQSVDGMADQEGNKLTGNFHQLQLLKAKHPQLKVLVALGGWSWSRWFSAGSATPALRRTLVASCIDLYIKGNLPVFKGHGGHGAAANLFDGFDLDWEHPALPGMPYNTVSKHDQHNYTALLAEFRKQFDELSKKDGRRYYLSAAINSSEKNVLHTEPAKYARSLDWINVMSYDFHGAWDKNGPTGFQSNLYADPADPDPEHASVDGGMQRLIKAGVPAQKLVMGIPYYARGWNGVAALNHGLYQKATGPAPNLAVGTGDGIEEGSDSYARIAAQKSSKFYHPVTKQMWTYDQGVFWTYDDPVVIREKIRYARQYKLGGLMSWSLDQDDAAFTLSTTMLELQKPL